MALQYAESIFVLHPTPLKRVGLHYASNLISWVLENVESHLQEQHNFSKCTIITILLPSQFCAGENSLRLWLKFSEITEGHWEGPLFLKRFIYS